VKRLAASLVMLGAAAMIVAIGWWWLTYREVIAFAYLPAREAGYCLVGETDICALARALCRGAHPLAIETYSSLALWAGFGLLCIGLAVDGWRQPEDADDRAIVPTDFWF
jgi:hypothetical protein